VGLHDILIGIDNHAITANPNSTGSSYNNITARDADSSFNTKRKNVNKVVRVESPLSFYILTSITPTWIEISNIANIIENSIYAQLSSSVDQNPSDTNPTVITYNTQDDISGLTHSTSINPGEITIVTAGIYFVMPQPQVGKTSGGTALMFDMFMQKDTGSGFVDVVNSNIKLTVKDADVTDVIVSGVTIELNANDKIRFMQRISSTTGALGLKVTAAETGPPTVPATPSIIFAMYRVGGI